MDEAELKQMEKQITGLQDEIKKREVECRTLESGKSDPKTTYRYTDLLLSNLLLMVWSELASLQSSLTSEEARDQLQATEKQVQHVSHFPSLNLIQVTISEVNNTSYTIFYFTPIHPLLCSVQKWKRN